MCSSSPFRSFHSFRDDDDNYDGGEQEDDGGDEGESKAYTIYLKKNERYSGYHLRIDKAPFM